VIVTSLIIENGAPVGEGVGRFEQKRGGDRARDLEARAKAK